MESVSTVDSADPVAADATPEPGDHRHTAVSDFESGDQACREPTAEVPGAAESERGEAVEGGASDDRERALDCLGDKLKDATQFVANLRGTLVDSLKQALSSTIDQYGGLDNALRMFLFKQLTYDTNGDHIINAADLAANPFRNFIQDYNKDGVITADDIVVEYIAGKPINVINPESLKK